MPSVFSGYILVTSAKCLVCKGGKWVFELVDPFLLWESGPEPRIIRQR